MAIARITIDSPKPPAEVFEYLARFSNAAEWDPGVASAEDLSPGPTAVGSVFRLQVTFLGRQLPLDYRVLELDAPRRVVVEAENRLVRSTDVIEVAPEGSGSRLTYAASLTLKGAALLATPLAEVAFTRIAQRAEAGLVVALGGGPTADAVAPRPDTAGSLGRRVVARTVDTVAEATVVPSFSRVGYSLRQQLEGWTDPPSMAGRVVVVTGATSGIGRATAVGLARLGATVHLVGRDAERGARAMAAVERAGGGAPTLDLVDLSDLDATAELGRRLVARHGRLDALVHAAGALSRTYTTTPAGLELTVATQLLAPYVLTAHLAPALAEAPAATVVVVSSGGMYTQPFDLDELEPRPEEYNGTVAYARVKRAQLLLAEDWARRFAATGVASFAMHPGWVDTPGLASGLPGFRVLARPLLRTAAQGADTAVWLAAGGPAADAAIPRSPRPRSGFYLDRRPRRDRRFPVAHPYSPGDAEALWAWCIERTGTSFPQLNRDSLTSPNPDVEVEGGEGGPDR